MKGVFILTHPTAICWCLLSEWNKQHCIGCPQFSPSCPQGWPQEAGESSLLLPLPPCWRSDTCTPFPYRSGPRGLRGRTSAKASWEEKTPQDASTLQLPKATCLHAFPCLTDIFPVVKKGREKWGWDWSSQTSLLFHGWGKLHHNFSLIEQDLLTFLSLLKLKGRSCDCEGMLEKHCL